MSQPTDAIQLDLFLAVDGDPPPPTAICCPHCRGTGRISALEPTYRRADSGTARAAGERAAESTRFRRDSQQGRVLAALSRRDMTAQETALSIHGSSAPTPRVEGTRRRVSSLYRLALIEPSGEERINAGSSTPSTVWRITDRGRAVLDRLDRTGWSE